MSQEMADNNRDKLDANKSMTRRKALRMCTAAGAVAVGTNALIGPGTAIPGGREAECRDEDSFGVDTEIQACTVKPRSSDAIEGGCPGTGCFYDVMYTNNLSLYYLGSDYSTVDEMYVHDFVAVARAEVLSKSEDDDLGWHLRPAVGNYPWEVDLMGKAQAKITVSDPDHNLADNDTTEDYVMGPVTKEEGRKVSYDWSEGIRNLGLAIAEKNPVVAGASTFHDVVVDPISIENVDLDDPAGISNEDEVVFDIVDSVVDGVTHEAFVVYNFKVLTECRCPDLSVELELTTEPDVAFEEFEQLNTSTSLRVGPASGYNNLEWLNPDGVQRCSRSDICGIVNMSEIVNSNFDGQPMELQGDILWDPYLDRAVDQDDTVEYYFRYQIDPAQDWWGLTESEVFEYGDDVGRYSITTEEITPDSVNFSPCDVQFVLDTGDETYRSNTVTVEPQ